MISSHWVAIWFCTLALLAIQYTECGKASRKIAEERRVRALRPRFVKRESQAPLYQAPDERIDDEYIVKLKDGLTDDQLAEFEEKFQALSEEHGEHIDFRINVTRLMKGFVARIPGDALDILRWLDEVEFVEEDEVVHAAWGWGLDRIDQADLPLDDRYYPEPFYLENGDGVSVFVFDTGIRFTHEVFNGRAFSFYDAFSDGYDGSDCTGHGTHVAGIIGGNTIGVANDVILYSCRVLSCDGTGRNSYTIAGMDYVASFDFKPAVVSMSLGGQASNAMNSAVRRLTEEGYIVVVSAGNDGYDACRNSPASALEAITVGATTSNDRLAWYSNYGGCVNILAPGTDIYSASYEGDDMYGVDSGTSFAAPYVSGVAALLLAIDSTLTQDGVFKILMNAAQSGKIDLSEVPESHRSLTANKLLQVPTSTRTSLKIFKEAKTYDDAEATCEANGMTLAKDRNSEIHDALIEMLGNNEMGGADIWINGKANFGTWYYTDGSYMPMGSYQPWAPGEPSSEFLCLQLWASAGHNWDDDLCTETKGFICQAELPMWLFSATKTFNDAESTCESTDLRLVKDISPGKHAAIIQLLAENEMEQSNVWLNGREDPTGIWVTNEGVPIGPYQPWAFNEPNGNNGCLQLWAGAGYKWDDIACTATRPYLCEEEPPMKLFTDATIYKKAYIACAEISMSLVKDTSAAKHAAIVALLQANGLETTDVWINGKHNAGSDDFVFTDGLPLGTYQPWATGEPVYSTAGGCLELRGTAGNPWAEAPCYFERPYICQPER